MTHHYKSEIPVHAHAHVHMREHVRLFNMLITYVLKFKPKLILVINVEGAQYQM